MDFIKKENSARGSDKRFAERLNVSAMTRGPGALNYSAADIDIAMEVRRVTVVTSLINKLAGPQSSHNVISACSKQLAIS
ncbi:hypothetical protein J6590_096231 [Homalodisca vitripennis]|nr:hypothetical protein J6590_030531 [Homalodisca vitripennis]KAG8324273.1 hypothetical protein J6590_096231 [Homalodisca vitripennis]